MHDRDRSKVAVVGAGLSGLAVAARLAYDGHEVHVFEKNNYFGGKATLVTNQDFVFDAGPSLFTMPDYVDEVFHYCGENPRDYYTYHTLTTICNYFYEDGLKIRASADIDEFAKEIEMQTNDTSESIKRFLKRTQAIHQITEPVFLRRSIHRFKSLMNWDTLKGIFQFRKINAFQTMEHDIRRYFKDERVVQLFCRYATYNGSNPYVAPATLNVIPYLEYGLGAYMPKGGIHAIPSALYQLGKKLGVNFHLKTKVDEILVEKAKTTGLRISNKLFQADRVVTNADIWPSYRHLLKSIEAPEKILTQERSSSALIFYWGIKADFPELDVHNILFSQDYEKEFSTLFNKEFPHQDPTVYIHVSSKVCREHAPVGSENWFVMVNAPRHNGQDWQKELHVIRENIITKVERVLKKNIRDLILTENILTPKDIEEKTGSHQGSLYGPSSNGRYAAFLRHSNASSRVKGLYFCGGSVHPGGGIPLVMSSAKIVADLIREDS